MKNKLGLVFLLGTFVTLNNFLVGYHLWEIFMVLLLVALVVGSRTKSRFYQPIRAVEGVFSFFYLVLILMVWHVQRASINLLLQGPRMENLGVLIIYGGLFLVSYLIEAQAWDKQKKGLVYTLYLFVILSVLVQVFRVSIALQVYVFILIGAAFLGFMWVFLLDYLRRETEVQKRI